MQKQKYYLEKNVNLIHFEDENIITLFIFCPLSFELV